MTGARKPRDGNGFLNIDDARVRALASSLSCPVDGREADADEPVTVAVLDHSPVYGWGLSMAMSNAGFTVVAPETVLDDHATELPRVALMPVETDDDIALAQHVQLVHPEVVIVGLLPASDCNAYRRAVAARLVCLVPRDSDLEMIVAVVRHAVRGFSVVPSDVMRALATAPSAEEHDDLTELEKEWIERLAHGTKVHELARSAGYSEREMFRRLKRVYQRIGASNRTEALVKAARRGLVPDSATSLRRR